MPAINVNPTRQELTRLKTRLRTSIRGHKLLKDKRDELMKQFMDVVRENRALRKRVEEGLMRAHGSFTVASALMSTEMLEQALLYPKQSVELDMTFQNIMSVNVPVYHFKTKSDDAGEIYPYGFATTSGELDGAVEALSGVLQDMLRLAEIEKTSQLLAEEIEKRGIKDKIHLRKGIIGSERWSEKMRRSICEKLGIDAYDIYGLTEVYGPGIGISCDAHDGIHYWDDFVYIEIIDPQTGETLPDGEWGEIVITTLRKEGAPLIRFRTHDLSRILPGDCPCGSKFPRLDTIQGRTDDMVKIKGVNLFPSQIEEILKTFPEVSSEYQMHISHLDGKDTMRLYVETNGSVDFLNLAKRIAERVKSRIGFTPLVKVVEIGVLPRSEKKTKRVIDTRYE